MTASEGKIVTSVSCHDSTVWMVSVNPGNVIELMFQEFNLDSHNPHTWVKVHNGDSRMSDLLVTSDGTTQPKPVRTTGNTMYIEYMAPDKPGRNGYEMKNERFVAIYSSHGENQDSVSDLEFKSTSISPFLTGKFISMQACSQQGGGLGSSDMAGGPHFVAETVISFLKVQA